MILNGTPVGIHGANEGASDEPQPGMIEIVTGKIVDQGARGAGSHEGINEDVLVENKSNQIINQ